MGKFELQNYIKEIHDIGVENKVSDSDALGMFIINLNAMRSFYKGAPELNFRELGQKWGALPFEKKNSQRAAVAKLMQKPATRPGRNAREE